MFFSVEHCFISPRPNSDKTKEKKEGKKEERRPTDRHLPWLWQGGRGWQIETIWTPSTERFRESCWQENEEGGGGRSAVGEGGGICPLLMNWGRSRRTGPHATKGQSQPSVHYIFCINSEWVCVREGGGVRVLICNQSSEEGRYLGVLRSWPLNKWIANAVSALCVWGHTFILIFRNVVGR